eukprot:GGOE01024673.1.p3 GENE.GGOE01024673.1~~GGOE01024673.1.p3  ORF type:complete len:131 (+),score=3.22 GGOE01024673.1:288-680(+)
MHFPSCKRKHTLSACTTHVDTDACRQWRTAIAFRHMFPHSRRIAWQFALARHLCARLVLFLSTSISDRSQNLTPPLAIPQAEGQEARWIPQPCPQKVCLTCRAECKGQGMSAYLPPILESAMFGGCIDLL